MLTIKKVGVEREKKLLPKIDKKDKRKKFSTRSALIIRRYTNRYSKKKYKFSWIKMFETESINYESVELNIIIT